MPNPSPGKPFHREPPFEQPPVWMHESVAAILGSKREARRQAILRLLDRVEITPPSGRRAPAARRSRS